MAKYVTVGMVKKRPTLCCVIPHPDFLLDLTQPMVHLFALLSLLTLDELPLPLDDLVAERPLLVVLEDEQVPPLDLVLLQHRLALHLHLLDLQLVHLAQQRQDLTLLVRADPFG